MISDRTNSINQDCFLKWDDWFCVKWNGAVLGRGGGWTWHNGNSVKKLQALDEYQQCRLRKNEFNFHARFVIRWEGMCTEMNWKFAEHGRAAALAIRWIGWMTDYWPENERRALLALACDRLIW